MWVSIVELVESLAELAPGRTRVEQSRPTYNPQNGLDSWLGMVQHLQPVSCRKLVMPTWYPPLHTAVEEQGGGWAAMHTTDAVQWYHGRQPTQASCSLAAWQPPVVCLCCEVLHSIQVEYGARW